MDGMEAGEWLFLIIVGAFSIYLITRRWFWLVVFFFGGLAAAFAMLASIIHFQILGALGFFVLMWLCGVIWFAINDDSII